MRFCKTFFLLFALFQIQLFAQPAYVSVEQGEEKFNENKITEAYALFEKAIAKEKDNFEAYTWRGRCYIAQNKPDLAIADFSQAIKLNKDFQKPYFYRGTLYANAKEYKKAIDDFSALLKLNPKYVDAYIQRGLCYSKNNQKDLALADLNKCIEQNAKSADVFYNRGLIYKEMSKDEEAIKDFTQTIAIKSDYSGAYFNRAIIYQKQNKYAQAVADYTKTIDYRNTADVVYINRATCNEALNKLDDALKDYNRLLDEVKSKDASLYTKRGIIKSKKALYAEAVKDFNKAVTADKADLTALYERGMANYKQGKAKFPTANIDFNKCIELKADMHEAYYGLASVLFEQQKFQPAIDNLNKAIKIKEEGNYLYLRSKCFYKIENKNACCSDLKRAADLNHPEAKKDAKTICFY
jgi:tetratricopeptide (TPR) repeat protein